jgi:hypothetical protein
MAVEPYADDINEHPLAWRFMADEESSRHSQI